MRKVITKITRTIWRTPLHTLVDLRLKSKQADEILFLDFITLTYCYAPYIDIHQDVSINM
jgi:hypothetical protein